MAWFSKTKYTSIKKADSAARSRVPKDLWAKCPDCLETIVQRDWDSSFRVCPRCGYHDRLSARERIDSLLDAGSFVERDANLVAGDPLEFVDSKPYLKRLAEAREKTNLLEAAVSGEGTLKGQPVSIAVMDTAFIGGSMGVAVGEKIARAMERGLDQKIPVIIVCASGGARMQEGIFSLMQMAKTSAIAGRLANAGVPLITILTHPSTGGVMASFASLGDVILAEPKALIGFAGPRVIKGTIKQILPPGFQRSEFVSDHGFIDIVTSRTQMKETIANLLEFFMFARNAATRSEDVAEDSADASARASSVSPAESGAEEPTPERAQFG